MLEKRKKAKPYPENNFGAGRGFPGYRSTRAGILGPPSMTAILARSRDKNLSPGTARHEREVKDLNQTRPRTKQKILARASQV